MNFYCLLCKLQLRINFSFEYHFSRAVDYITTWNYKNVNVHFVKKPRIHTHGYTYKYNYVCIHVVQDKGLLNEL